MKKTKQGIYKFLRSGRPAEITAYLDFWNLFAKEKGLPGVKKLSDTRKKKFNIRIKESAFDFTEILRKAGDSEFILTSNFFTIDWIIENDTNYQKVLEGNYDVKKKEMKIFPVVQTRS